MKWYAYVNDRPIEELSEVEKREFQLAVIDKIASFGFKVHKVTPEEEVKHEEKVI